MKNKQANINQNKIILIFPNERWGTKISKQILTTGLFWMLRARFAYFKVLRVSSALISAGLMQAGKEKKNYVRRNL